MIVIFAVALIVVGPDKLPGLARSLAKGLMEMKNTLNQVKEGLTQDGEVLDSVQKDLQKTAEELKEKMIDADPSAWQAADPVQKNKDSDIIDLQPITDSPAESADPDAVLVKEDTGAEAIDTKPETPGEANSETPQEAHQGGAAGKTA
jgi:sec-independent protein translocase protein TatB